MTTRTPLVPDLPHLKHQPQARPRLSGVRDSNASSMATLAGDLGTAASSTNSTIQAGPVWS